jgi:hypothetical protein
MSKKPEFKYELGSVASDKITGFEGVIMCRTQWLNNCNVYGIKPQKLKDDKPIGLEYFDEPDIEIVEKDAFEPKRKTGGPAHSVQRTNR